MKKLLLILLFLMSLAASNAQDKIITVSKDTIECRIISVGADWISYEQKTSENYFTGKSIAISDVYQYYREGQSDRYSSTDSLKSGRQKPEHRYLLTIQGGLARSYTDTGGFRNTMISSGVAATEADDYIGRLKNGYHINAGFQYLLTTFLGVGADYTMFYSASEGNFLINGYGGINLPVYVKMDLKERMYTHFAGPTVLFQQFPDRKGKLKISETISPGIVLFRGESRGNEYQIYWDGYYSGEPPQYYDLANSVSKSTAFGVKIGLSFEYFISPQVSAGLAGNFIWAKLKKVSVKSLNYDLEDQELGKAINISHNDYGFTVRYNF